MSKIIFNIKTFTINVLSNLYHLCGGKISIPSLPKINDYWFKYEIITKANVHMQYYATLWYLAGFFKQLEPICSSTGGVHVSISIDKDTTSSPVLSLSIPNKEFCIKTKWGDVNFKPILNSECELAGFVIKTKKRYWCLHKKWFNVWRWRVWIPVYAIYEDKKRSKLCCHICNVINELGMLEAYYDITEPDIIKSRKERDLYQWKLKDQANFKLWKDMVIAKITSLASTNETARQAQATMDGRPVPVNRAYFQNIAEMLVEELS